MSKDFPGSLSDIQKDLNDFLSQKYGGKVVVENPSFVGGEEGVHTEEKSTAKAIHFDLKPMELESYLKDYMVGQEDAIETIATKICTHFNRMTYERNNPDIEKIIGGIKPNMLMIGPTGVGKTYMIKLIADKLGVPFVKGDATKFTETGYVGGDVEDLIRDLVKDADGNIELAEYGIVYLDEVDKIATASNKFGPDISRSGVQRNLLKVMEESEVDLKNPMDIASQMEAAMQATRSGKVDRKKISTKNILFVMSGAFQDLDDIIKKRMNAQPMGFTSGVKKGSDDSINWLKHVERQDLIDFGFESEFVGRLPVITALDNLTVEGLFDILNNPKSSVILSKKRDFLAYDIELHFEEDALKEIAIIASKDKTGARSLMSVCENILIRFEKFLPSSNITSLTVTKELVKNPNIVLNRLLVQHAIFQIVEDFQIHHGIGLSFTNDAIDFCVEEAKKEKISPYELLQIRLKNYEYGLKLLGKNNFEITKDILKDYQQYLDDLIKKAYDQKENK